MAKETTKKASNWTDAQVAALEAAYTGSECNSSLDTMIAGKTAAAVRSKLVSMGLYEKADPAAASGTAAQRKVQIVSAIEILVGMPKNSLETLEKASKSQLEALSKALTQLSDRSNADQGIKEPQSSEESE